MKISKITVMLRFAIIPIIILIGGIVDARTISGKVVDENGKAIEFANVVLNNDSIFISGRVTDKVGFFFI